MRRCKNVAHTQRMDWTLLKASLLPDLEMAGRADFQPCSSRFRRGILQPEHTWIFIATMFSYAVK